MLLVGIVGGWAAITEISGAVIAPGKLVVDQQREEGAAPDRRRRRRDRVKDGDRVKKGDVVVRLDETQARANLAIVSKALDELVARKARNEAERDGADKSRFPADLMARRADPDVASMLAGEQQAVRAPAHGARRPEGAAPRAASASSGRRSPGNDGQVSAKTKEIDWIQQELKGVRALWKQNLVPFSR